MPHNSRRNHDQNSSAIGVLQRWVLQHHRSAIADESLCRASVIIDIAYPVHGDDPARSVVVGFLVWFRLTRKHRVEIAGLGDLCRDGQIDQAAADIRSDSAGRGRICLPMLEWLNASGLDLCLLRGGSRHLLRGENSDAGLLFQ